MGPDDKSTCLVGIDTVQLNGVTVDDDDDDDDNDSKTLAMLPASTVTPLPQSCSDPKSYRELYNLIPLPQSSTSKHIRVLDIDPSSSLLSSVLELPRSDVLSGTLRVVSLDSDLSFSALSYVWGSGEASDDSSSPPPNFICNGISIPITPNCHSALRHIAVGPNPTTVWVDAICIDQSSDAEKQQQIGLMGEIYSGASKVLAWLGEGDHFTDLAMDYLASRAYARWTTPSTDDKGRPVPAGRTSDRLRFQLYLWRRWLFWPWYRSLHAGLNRIFSHAWITRIWTLQEAVLTRNLHILCRTKQVPWIDVVYALDAMGFAHYERMPPGIAAWRRLAEIWKHHHHHRDEDGDVDDLLDGIRAHRAAIDRDVRQIFLEIYGILLGVWGLGCALSMFATLIFIIYAAAAGHNRWAKLGTAGFFSVLVGFLYSFWPTNTDNDEVTWTRFKRLTLGESILSELVGRQARFDKDIYFGTVSLLRSRGQHIEDVDYAGTSTGLSYALLCRGVAEYTGSLEFLLLAPCVVPGGDRCPSWNVYWPTAPTWWIRHVQDWKFRGEEGLQLDGDDLVKMSRWEKCQDELAPGDIHATVVQSESGSVLKSEFESTPKWEFSPDGLRLKVYGRVMGHVQWSSGRLERKEGDEDEAMRDQRWCMFLCKAFLGLEADTNMITYLWTQDSWFFKKAPSGWSDLRDAIIVKLNLEDEQAFSRDISQGLTYSARDRSYGIGKAVTINLTLSSLLNKLERLFRYLENKKLSLIRGKECGLGFTAGALEGDTVVIIQGVSLPMVLRQTDSRGGYQVLGPAFLPKINDATSTLHTGPLQEFTLV